MKREDVKNRILLDSFALLAFLKKEDGYKKVIDLLSTDETHLLMNDINIGETFYILARERGVKKAEYFLEVILPALAVTNIGNSLQEVIEAAKIKAKHPISYADCFVVATAIKEKAAIITGDPAFKHVENIVTVDWL